MPQGTPFRDSRLGRFTDLYMSRCQAFAVRGSSLASRLPSWPDQTTVCHRSGMVPYTPLLASARKAARWENGLRFWVRLYTVAAPWSCVSQAKGTHKQCHSALRRVPLQLPSGSHMGHCESGRSWRLPNCSHTGSASYRARSCAFAKTQQQK